ncbi:MAG: flagellar hook capping FlgD N-terminal domain-containing protein [bacterium]
MNGVSGVSGVGSLAIQKMGLGRDDFLKLLTAEMQNQNPLEPLENKEFIAQLATFSTLEQMISLNDSFTNFMNINSKAGVLSVLGKQVSVKISDTQTITGMVEEVYYDKNNKPYIKVIDNLGNITETAFENIVSVKMEPEVGPYSGGPPPV